MAKKTLFLGNDVAVRYTGNGTRYNVIVFRCAGNLPLIMKNGRVIPATWPHFLNLEGFFGHEGHQKCADQLLRECNVWPIYGSLWSH